MIKEILMVGTIMLGFALIMAYSIFPRQTKNLIMKMTKKKQYVVVHFKYMASHILDVYNVVPSTNYTWEHRTGIYILNPRDSYHQDKNGRLHFRIEEGNSIPISFVRDSTNDILFRSMELKTALKNNVMTDIFRQKSDMAFTISLIALFIIIIVALYAINNIQHSNELMEQLKGQLIDKVQVKP